MRHDKHNLLCLIYEKRTIQFAKATEKVSRSMEYDADSLESRKATPNRARLWTVEEIERLIKVWSKHEVLYNTRHQDYYKREKRSVAMSEIHEEMGGINLVDIIRKMENLRSYFGREIKKLHDSGVVGSAAGKSRWAYFDKLIFLEGHMNQKKATPRPALDQMITRYDSDGGENINGAVGNLEDENDAIYRVEPVEVPRQPKRQKLNDKSKLDAAIHRLHTPRQPPTSTTFQPGLNLGHATSTTIRKDSLDTYAPQDSSYTSSQLSQPAKNERDVNIMHEDMLFAEHVGRTIMSITDELLKEDLKLQIQQSLCATKRKQIALQQQQQKQQLTKHQNSQHSINSPHNMNSAHWQDRPDKQQEGQPPTLVSFVSMESPGSPVHSGRTMQMEGTEPNHNSTDL